MLVLSSPLFLFKRERGLSEDPPTRGPTIKNTGLTNGSPEFGRILLSVQILTPDHLNLDWGPLTNYQV
jgi:hypothetical protein